MLINHPKAREIKCVLQEIYKQLSVRIFWTNEDEKTFYEFIDNKSKELDYDFREDLQDLEDIGIKI